MILFHNYLRGKKMYKVIVKRVPKKTDRSIQHAVFKHWSGTMVEKYPVKGKSIVTSNNEFSKERNDKKT